MADVTEDQLLAAVVDVCRLRHVLVAHFRPARTGQGWRTPVQGDGNGFPDLVIAGPGGVLFRELKSATGEPSAEQIRWHNALDSASADVGIWRPRHLTDGTITANVWEISKPREWRKA